MTPLEQLKAILHEQYISEDGDEYKIELKPGLTGQQIEALKQKLPVQHLPTDVKELLEFAGGFEFDGLGETITFDRYGYFGMEELFPNSVELAGDGAGNFWVLDIDNKGNWGSVFFACHDPAVIVKHSEDLAAFIRHVHEFGKDIHDSNLHIIQEETVLEVVDDPTGGFIDLAEARASTDPVLSSFAQQLPDNFVIADLCNKPVRAGFAWGKFGPRIDNAVRHQGELLWGFEKKEKKGFLSKLFGR